MMWTEKKTNQSNKVQDWDLTVSTFQQWVFSTLQVPEVQVVAVVPKPSSASKRRSTGRGLGLFQTRPIGGRYGQLNS